jgi:glyoxylase-like metal-dependent hydrolase (beta-lactamase superfamily II)
MRTAVAIAAFWTALAVWSCRADPPPGVDVDAVVETLETLRADAARRPDALPVAFETRLTAWQEAPRWLVLSGDRTPDEVDPYVMTHPSFAFRWSDGSRLVVDAGLAPEGARAFGRPSELLGAEKTVCAADAFADLDPTSVRAAVFSHLHVDHVQGLEVLCAGGTTIPVRLSAEQRVSDERYEAQGRETLETMASDGCVALAPLATEGGGPAPGLTGFPGVHRVAAPGHTPGSQLVVGFLPAEDGAGGGGAVRAVVVSGDVVNHRAGFRHDRPKPWWYRRLVVREVDALQARNRQLLAELDRRGFEIRVDHHLEIPPGVEGEPCP